MTYGEYGTATWRLEERHIRPNIRILNTIHGTMVKAGFIGHQPLQFVAKE